MQEEMGKAGSSQERLEHTCSVATESASLHDMIVAHGLIEDFLTSHHVERVHALLETVPDSAERLNRRPPSSAALRHRLADFLQAKGYRSTPEVFADCGDESTLEVLTSLVDSDEWATGRMMELELLIMDSLPLSKSDAHVKASWLLNLLKQDSIYDPVALAFALEECFEVLASG